ncbi:ArgS-related anticodon-binding protein NrtL [Streptomyces sp. NPDC091292]|uniref:ArgS-related anticodon-binding protein NrtL n=1 Tax=Streptomyces sp. NPDC091292 TaxID=3365991 RepID=UPI0038201BDD
MTPVDLSRTVCQAVRRAVDGGELAVAVPVRVLVERTRPGGRGDYATNVALQLARPAGRPARQVAEILRHRLIGTPGLAGVDITGPGFLNLTLDPTATTGLVAEILRQGTRYGYGDTLDGQAGGGQVGALPAPHPHGTRAQVIADALSRIIASQSGQSGSLHELPGDGDGDGDEVLLWSLLHPAPHDRPHPLADLLVQRESNPLFRVRYAHSRTRALTREAARLGFTSTPDSTEPAGSGLLQVLAEYPLVLQAAARHHSPDRLARHLVLVADAFLRFHAEVSVLPVGDEKPLAAHRARLALAEAAGAVLAGGLDLLGMHAPEHL